MPERISSDLTAPKKVKLIHRGRNITKANVYECLYHGQRVISKDYKDRNAFIKATIGRWFISRELKMYSLLKGMPGIHKVIQRADPFSLLLDYLDGTTLSEMNRESIPPSMFASLKTIIEKIHREGVACGDIHRRDVLITNRGEVFLLDLATGWQKGHKLNIISCFIFKKFISLDWLAFYRLREKYAGIPPSQEEKKMFQDVLKFHAAGRWMKRMIDFFLEKK